MKIPCKKLRENAILPTRGTALAAGVDLYALLPDGQESAAVAPQGKYLFPTGIAVEIPEGTSDWCLPAAASPQSASSPPPTASA